MTAARLAASPPSWPVSMRLRASRCCSLALASRMRAAVRLPAVHTWLANVSARTNLVPARLRPSRLPSLTSKQKSPWQRPPVGIWPKAQGQGHHSYKTPCYLPPVGKPCSLLLLGSSLVNLLLRAAVTAIGRWLLVTHLLSGLGRKRAAMLASIKYFVKSRKNQPCRYRHDG